VSGLQIVESRDGQAWGRPYYRVTDYVTIMRNMAEAGPETASTDYRPRGFLFGARRSLPPRPLATLIRQLCS
jgi:hypothetical protein